MRNRFWQRLALIFLLMSRLVIGELSHAMPMTHSGDMSDAAHHQMTDEMSPLATDHPACHEHASGKQHHHAGDAADDSSTHSSGKKDCCKSGECACPCLHVPCSALDEPVLSPVAVSLLRIPHGVDGLVSQRPSGLFRPPA